MIPRRRRSALSDIDTVFEGKTLTMLAKNRNVYVQVETPGSIDQLVEVLQPLGSVPTTIDVTTMKGTDAVQPDTMKTRQNPQK